MMDRHQEQRRGRSGYYRDGRHCGRNNSGVHVKVTGRRESGMLKSSWSMFQIDKWFLVKACFSHPHFSFFPILSFFF